jgi:hypothetical protein
MVVHIGTVIGSTTAALIVALVTYLAREKQMSIEDKLDTLTKKVDEYEKRNKRRHQITLEWLDRLTSEVDGVSPPDEVDTDISFKLEDEPGIPEVTRGKKSKEDKGN